MSAQTQKNTAVLRQMTILNLSDVTHSQQLRLGRLNVKAKKRWQKWKKGCVISVVFSLAMEHREGSWEKQAKSAVQVRGAARKGYTGEHP